jgi:ubiquinone/menaquinone biosynthesis C-methylase UbiE
MLEKDSNYFQELQTQTGWGKTLAGFAAWCEPQPGSLTLDVGCGPGLLPALFARMGCRAVGVDLDPGMFRPYPLHRQVCVGDVYQLPFSTSTFNIVTCSNLMFLLTEPQAAMKEIRRLLVPGGRLTMLNPSENLSEHSASEFVREKDLQGMASATLINWARRAEQHHRWTEQATSTLYEDAGFQYKGSVLKMGRGFARFSWGARQPE